MKKYIVLLTAFIASLLISAGSASWIIINQITNEIKQGEPNLALVLELYDTEEGGEGFDNGHGQLLGHINSNEYHWGTAYVDTDNDNELDDDETTTVDGKFEITYINNSLLSTTNTTQVNVKFTPKSSYYKTPETITKTVTMTPVAYIGNNYYGTIEGALSAATSGNAVYVIPNNVDVNPYIIKECIVESGVTLRLPYNDSDTDVDYSLNTATGNLGYLVNGTNIKTKVTLYNGVNLTVNGSLVLCGIVSGQNSKALTSCTVDSWANITMMQGSAIVNNGTINCFGTITNASGDGTAQITVSKNASVTSPLSIVEHRGGSEFLNFANLGVSDYATLAVGGTVAPSLYLTPFTRFLMPNIMCNTTYEYGSTLYGFADLVADSVHNYTNAAIIGTGKSIFQTDDASVDFKFDSKNLQNVVTFKGNMTLNSMSLQIAIKKTIGSYNLNGKVNMSTESVFFPISNFWNITFAPGVNGNTTVSIPNQNIKIMPGATVTIENGVTVNAENRSIAVYGQIFEGANYTINHTNFNYGQYTGASNYTGSLTTGDNPNYNTYDYTQPFEAGKLTVNGTLNVGKLGNYNTFTLNGYTNEGIINSTGDGKITVSSSNSVTSSEVTASEKTESTNINYALYLNGSNRDQSSTGEYDWKGTSWALIKEITPDGGDEGGNSGGNCIAAGTLITLADGTQKKVEDLLLTDILLVYNHETGEYDEAAIVLIEADGWDYYNVINLVFSDGTVTRLIYEHALFDLTLNKYVYITERNYAEYVGHEFAASDGETYKTVTLIEAYVTNEYTGSYSLITAYHLNYFIDGLLSIPGGIDGLFNIFEYGENLKYDEEQMQADIEQYGLYTYEDFAEYVPLEVYEAFPAAYFKVAVGKGMITYEDIIGYIQKYLVKNNVI